jgi:hypothetical protein
MSLSKKTLRMLFVFGVLELGAICGVPASPEKIEELMNVHQRVEAVEVLRKEDLGDGEPPADL